MRICSQITAFAVSCGKARRSLTSRRALTSLISVMPAASTAKTVHWRNGSRDMSVIFGGFHSKIEIAERRGPVAGKMGKRATSARFTKSRGSVHAREWRKGQQRSRERKWREEHELCRELLVRPELVQNASFCCWFCSHFGLEIVTVILRGKRTLPRGF